MWCYLVIACFDWSVVRAYILNSKFMISWSSSYCKGSFNSLEKEVAFVMSNLLWVDFSLTTFLRNIIVLAVLIHYVKSVRIWSFYDPYFPAFGLNMERYSVRLRENADQKNTRIWILFTQRCPSHVSYVIIAIAFIFLLGGKL